MKIRRRTHRRVGTVIMALLAAIQMSGCTGMALPPVTVNLTLVQDVEIQGASLVAGTADVTLGAFCDLFNRDDLDAMVRASAGDLIADLVTITSVELTSTNLAATEGSFQPFTSAELTLTILELGGETLLLGTASNDAGLGTNVSLRKDDPVDLLNDLEEDQCGSPTLHLDGADILAPGDITFDVTVTVAVFAELR